MLFYREIIKKETTALVFVQIAPNLSACGRTIREGNGIVYTIFLREPRMDWFLHELAHVLEWEDFGVSSEHGYTFMMILEELEDRYL